ncbi:MAG: efflux RND transporter periplasmic adaptor subunit [Bryobacteraceae bacterium]
MSLFGCKQASVSGEAHPQPPAKVQNGGLKESDLAQIVLTPQAETRLGIELSEVAYRPAPQLRTYSGEITLPPGAALTVTAPLAGTLAPAGEQPAAPGSLVKADQVIFVLKPLAPLQRDLRANVEAEVNAAQARAEAARSRAERAERMLKDQVGSVRAVETAKEELKVAETALDAARKKLDQLERTPLDADVNLRVKTPHGGLLRQLHATAGQTVSSGAPLFEVAQLDRVWVRVPVYSGEIQQLARGAGAEVRSLGGALINRNARPVAAPPSADPFAATSDLYFDLPNPAMTLRPGERVSAALAVAGETKSLQAPLKAVVYDAHGGAWVYQSLGKGAYLRRRVEVRTVRNGVAFLSRGPESGSRVVTDGAAELFGTEFGAGK